MPNYCAKLDGHSVSDHTLQYVWSVIAADGATYPVTIDIDGSELASNITNFNASLKAAIEEKLLSQFGVSPGPGNKIVLMGGGV